jgi:hypothetical protein
MKGFIQMCLVRALQALLSLGEDSSTGSTIVELVAGAAGGDIAGFAKYFTPAELGQLLELERQALVHAKASEQGRSV